MAIRPADRRARTARPHRPPSPTPGTPRAPATEFSPHGSCEHAVAGIQACRLRNGVVTNAWRIHRRVARACRGVPRGAPVLPRVALGLALAHGAATGRRNA